MSSKETRYAEFVATLGMYVRDTDGTTMDQRDSFARKLSEQPADDLLSFEMEPSDIAVIISASVTVDPNQADDIAVLVGKALETALKRHEVMRRMPLTAKPDHPVAALLTGLLETSEGRKTYRTVASLLAKAVRDPSVRSLISTDSEYKAATEADQIAPPVDETPRAVDDGNLFDRDERFDAVEQVEQD